MTGQQTWQPACTPATLDRRAKLFAAIRSFFAARRVLEVHTPVLTRHAVTDPHIDCIQTTDGRFARSSPEYAHKRLLASGCGDCYELGPAFRRGEQGRWHNPEFHLLEWYRLGWTRRRLQRECLELLRTVAPELESWPVYEIGYADLGLELAGIDPLAAGDRDLARLAGEHGFAAPRHGGRGELLDFLFSRLVQPRLPARRITLVQHFPPEQCALAKIACDARGRAVADRFEVFLGPVEIANGYQELTDADELAARFRQDNANRERLGKQPVSPEPELLAAMRHGLPDCAGIALGVERLLACLLDRPDLASVQTFPEGRGQ